MITVMRTKSKKSITSADPKLIPEEYVDDEVDYIDYLKTVKPKQSKMIRFYALRSWCLRNAVPIQKRPDKLFNRCLDVEPMIKVNDLLDWAKKEVKKNE